jgi:hypothetical protein
MRVRTTLTLAAAVLAASTACTTMSAGTGTPAAAKSSAAPAPAPPAKATDAAGITRQLTTKGLPVKLTITYDATSDPNGRLGRPHQYLSKTAFDDTRVADSPQAKEDATKDRRDSISYGGTVEVFPNADDATVWVKYVDGAQQALGGLIRPDYIYQHGAVVVRVSHLLTPDQAKVYEKAIA